MHGDSPWGYVGLQKQVRHQPYVPPTNNVELKPGQEYGSVYADNASYVKSKQKQSFKDDAYDDKRGFNFHYEVNNARTLDSDDYIVKPTNRADSTLNYKGPVDYPTKHGTTHMSQMDWEVRPTLKHVTSEQNIPFGNLDHTNTFGHHHVDLNPEHFETHRQKYTKTTYNPAIDGTQSLGQMTNHSVSKFRNYNPNIGQYIRPSLAPASVGSIYSTDFDTITDRVHQKREYSLLDLRPPMGDNKMVF